MPNFLGILASLPHMPLNTKQNHIYHPKQTLHNMNHITSFLLIPFLNNFTPLILSFSLFSFLFFHPSWLPFSRLSEFPSQFLLHGANNKNYIFLLCNGLLVLVVKYSYCTLNTSTITSHEDSLIFKGYDLEPSTEVSALFGWGKTIFPEYAQQVASQESNSPPDQTEPSHSEKEQVENRREEKREQLDEEDGKLPMITYSNHEGQEKWIRGHCRKHDDSKVQMEEPEKELYIEEDEYDEEEGENGKMSREELNRKIEDFIRKRKEELRIEARQQLIVVYD